MISSCLTSGFQSTPLLNLSLSLFKMVVQVECLLTSSLCGSVHKAARVALCLKLPQQEFWAEMMTTVLWSRMMIPVALNKMMALNKTMIPVALNKTMAPVALRKTMTPVVPPRTMMTVHAPM
jgi:hypothetical protein